MPLREMVERTLFHPGSAIEIPERLKSVPPRHRIELEPGLLEKFTWMTGWRTQSGPIRFRSKYLPVRHSREQAQKDLDTWADVKDLEEVE